MQTFDIIIVGGGMVGASLALALRSSNLKIALVDRNPFSASLINTESPWKNRVSALNEASVTLFEALGVWQSMLSQRVCPFDHMTVWDREGTGEITFDAPSVQRDVIGYIVENDVVQQALRIAVEASDIHSFWGEESVRFQFCLLYTSPSPRDS